MASSTQWTWVWVNSRSWWWTGRPGVLQSVGLHSQTRLSNWTELNWRNFFSLAIFSLFSASKFTCYTSRTSKHKVKTFVCQHNRIFFFITMLKHYSGSGTWPSPTFHKSLMIISLCPTNFSASFTIELLKKEKKWQGYRNASPTSKRICSQQVWQPLLPPSPWTSLWKPLPGLFLWMKRLDYNSQPFCTMGGFYKIFFSQFERFFFWFNSSFTFYYAQRQINALFYMADSSCSSGLKVSIVQGASSQLHLPSLLSLLPWNWVPIHNSDPLTSSLPWYAACCYDTHGVSLFKNRGILRPGPHLSIYMGIFSTGDNSHHGYSANVLNEWTNEWMNQTL